MRKPKLAVLTLSSLFAAGPLIAQHLEQNGDFDLKTEAPWAFTYASDSGWQSKPDADACSFSGSIWAFSGDDGGTQRSVVHQCIPITVPNTLFARLEYRQTFGFLGLELAFFSDTVCDAAHFLSVSGSYGHGATIVWTEVEHSAAAPDDAQSVLVQVWSFDSTPTPFVQEIDRVWVAYAPQIFTDDFEAVDTCRWSLTQPPF